MKYFSMFSGIGGFELGIQRAYSGMEDERETPVGLRAKGQSKRSDDTRESLSPSERPDGYSGDSPRSECIGYSEIDKYAIKVYERNFNECNCDRQHAEERSNNERTESSPNDSDGSRRWTCAYGNEHGGHTNFGDATAINPTELPDFDLLVGGFPCQAFSIAGKRAGFNDTRGTLFFDIARILKEKQPRHLVLENVKGLLSHDGGRTFTTILGVLADLGYFVEWQVLNSKNFGVPQNRERVFIVGHLGGEPKRKVFPITRGTGKNLKQLIGGSQGNRVYDTNGISSTIASQAGGLGAKTGLYNVTPVLTPNRLEKRQNGRRFKEAGDPSFTLTGQDIHGVKEGTRIRRLTPKECERLQGFPDNWTALGVGDEPISDSQRYKMCGNAVTVNVVQVVMARVL